MLTQDEMLVLFRDMMTAMDVGQKAELGYYDVEFDTYGCTHYEGGERHYHVSSNAVKIYDFIEQAALADCYPTAPMAEVFKKPIPRGLKEILELDLKKDLAVQMQSVYSTAFFEDLHCLASEMQQNTAADLLDDYMTSLECTFDRDQFNLFEDALVLAVSQQTLAHKDHQLLLARLNDERKNISSELRPHDLFNQTFHAFAYKQDSAWAYIFDARKDYVYEKRLTLELSGAVISPVLTKVCFYNYDYRLIDARRDFQRALPAIFGENFRTLLEKLHALPARKPAQEFDQIVRDLTDRHGPAVTPTLEMYQYRWLTHK